MWIRSIALPAVLMLCASGCHTGTTGGPGASEPRNNEPVVNVGRADESFNLKRAKVSLRQGESKSVAIGIDRTTNFAEDVAIQLDPLPPGLTIDSRRPVIRHGDTEARFILTAGDDAAVGDFTVRVTGHPSRGADATNELVISVEKK